MTAFATTDTADHYDSFVHDLKEQINKWLQTEILNNTTVTLSNPRSCILAFKDYQFVLYNYTYDADERDPTYSHHYYFRTPVLGDNQTIKEISLLLTTSLNSLQVAFNDYYVDVSLNDYSITASGEALSFKTINGEVITGSGNIQIESEPLPTFKTINGEVITGSGNIELPTVPTFKTINGKEITGVGDISTADDSVTAKTLHGDSLLGEGEIIFNEEDFEVERNSSGGLWSDGGRIEFTTNVGHIGLTGQVTNAGNSTWRYSDFIPLSRIDGQAGIALPHASVSFAAYYSGPSFTGTFLKNIVSTSPLIIGRELSKETILAEAPEGATHVVFCTNLASQQLYATVNRSPEVITNLIIKSKTKAPKKKLLHITFDDTNECLQQITENESTLNSVFDNPFFKALKEVHDAYGTTFSLFLFLKTYSDETKSTLIFDVTNTTNKFASEFAANSHWLKFGYHSIDNYTNYGSNNTLLPTDTASHYNEVISAIMNFTGTVECIDTVVRLQNFAGTLEHCIQMRDCDAGITGLLSGDYSETSTPPTINSSTGYYLSPVNAAILAKKGKFFDVTNQIMFFPSNLRLDNISVANLPAYMEGFKTPLKYVRSQIMNMYCHENQMIASQSQINNYKQRFEIVSQWALENDYEFDFPMNRINNI